MSLIYFSLHVFDLYDFNVYKCDDEPIPEFIFIIGSILWPVVLLVGLLLCLVYSVHFGIVLLNKVPKFREKDKFINKH